MWVTVFDSLDHIPPHLATMWVSVFESQNWTPPQLPTMVVSVLHGYGVTPPQLPSMVVSVSMTAGPPPKVLMVSDTEQLPPPLVQQTGLHKIYIFRPQIQCNQWVNIKLDHIKYIYLGLCYTAKWITQKIYI